MLPSYGRLSILKLVAAAAAWIPTVQLLNPVAFFKLTVLDKKSPKKIHGSKPFSLEVTAEFHFL
jgi:hypothetical protein